MDVMKQRLLTFHTDLIQEEQTKLPGVQISTMLIRFSRRFENCTKNEEIKITKINPKKLKLPSVGQRGRHHQHHARAI